MKIKSNTNKSMRIRGFSAVAIGAFVTAGAAVYSAASSASASSDASAAAQAQNAAKSQQLQGQQKALQNLYNKQKSPQKFFNNAFTSMPGLLNQVVPSLSGLAARTAKTMTASNIDTYNQALAALYPGYAQQQARQLSVLQSEDPANMGRQQLEEISKQLAPFIQTGSVNPNNGQVGNGLAGPTQLYRNAISGAYQQRLSQFNQDNNNYLGMAQNAALRQQVQAPQFLSGFLNLANQDAMGIAQMGISQQQSNINAQASLLQAVMQQPNAQFNPLPFQQATQQGIGTAANSLATAFGNPNSAAYLGSQSPNQGGFNRGGSPALSPGSYGAAQASGMSYGGYQAGSGYGISSMS